MNIARLPWKIRYQGLRRAGSEFRRVRTQLLHRHCTVSFEGAAYIEPGFDLRIPGTGTLRVGTNVQFRRGFTCEIAGDGVVTIGDRTILSYDTTIQCSTRIDIGEDCLLAPRTLIVDGNHRFRDPALLIQQQGYEFRDVRIGDGAMILAGAVVTASVGERTVVASNSVVSRPMDSYALVGGVPARVLERFGPGPETGEHSVSPGS